MSTLPVDFINSMKRLLGDDYGAYEASFLETPFRGLRFNRRVLSAADSVIGALDLTHENLTGDLRDENLSDDLTDEKKAYEKLTDDLARKLTGQSDRVPWNALGYYAGTGDELSSSPYYHSGLFYIQEPSAMSAAGLFDVDKRDLVLDLCAAPGGKSTDLAGRCAFLLSNDYSASRARGLLKNMELYGGANYAVCAMDPKELSALYPETFDKVIVDAPCSGEGMFRKDPSLIKSWTDRGPAEYAPIQASILDEAYEMLKCGGMMMYSTCTFSPMENEENIIAFFNRHSDMEIVDIKVPDEWGFADGLMGLSGAKRLYPHRVKGEGHFICLMRKKSYERSFGLCPQDDSKVKDDYRSDNVSELCKENVYEHIFIKDRLYMLPRHRIDLDKKVRFLRTGLLMGEYKKDRFIPAHSLALYFGRQDCKNGQVSIETDRGEFTAQVLDLSTDDDRTLRYLRGETIELDPSYKGHVLVCCDGYPLGWGRGANGKLKNDRPVSQ